jgi:hypothetical protein
MKMYEVVEIQLHTFSTSARDGVRHTKLEIQSSVAAEHSGKTNQRTEFYNIEAPTYIRNFLPHQHTSATSFPTNIHPQLPSPHHWREGSILRISAAKTDTN